MDIAYDELPEKYYKKEEVNVKLACSAKRSRTWMVKKFEVAIRQCTVFAVWSW